MTVKMQTQREKTLEIVDEAPFTVDIPDGLDPLSFLAGQCSGCSGAVVVDMGLKRVRPAENVWPVWTLID